MDNSFANCLLLPSNFHFFYIISTCDTDRSSSRNGVYLWERNIYFALIDCVGCFGNARERRTREKWINEKIKWKKQLTVSRRCDKSLVFQSTQRTLNRFGFSFAPHILDARNIQSSVVAHTQLCVPLELCRLVTSNREICEQKNIIVDHHRFRLHVLLIDSHFSCVF